MYNRIQNARFLENTCYYKSLAKKKKSWHTTVPFHDQSHGHVKQNTWNQHKESENNNVFKQKSNVVEITNTPDYNTEIKKHILKKRAGIKLFIETFVNPMISSF